MSGRVLSIENTALKKMVKLLFHNRCVFLDVVNLFTPPAGRVLFRIHLITVIVSNTFLKAVNAEEKLESQIIGFIEQLASLEASA